MTCQFQKVPVVFNTSLVDLENCTSFLKTTCDLWNSTCVIDLLKLLARHTTGSMTGRLLANVKSNFNHVYGVLDKRKLLFDTFTFDTLVFWLNLNVGLNFEYVVLCCHSL